MKAPLPPTIVANDVVPMVAEDVMGTDACRRHHALPGRHCLPNLPLTTVVPSGEIKEIR